MSFLTSKMEVTDKKLKEKPVKNPFQSRHWWFTPLIPKFRRQRPGASQLLANSS
jgi:hypothetical protein